MRRKPREYRELPQEARLSSQWQEKDLWWKINKCLGQKLVLPQSMLQQGEGGTCSQPDLDGEWHLAVLKGTILCIRDLVSLFTCPCVKFQPHPQPQKSWGSPEAFLLWPSQTGRKSPDRLVIQGPCLLLAVLLCKHRLQWLLFHCSSNQCSLSKKKGTDGYLSRNILAPLVWLKEQAHLLVW